VLATVGDLVEDVVVRLGGPIQHGADTAASISRRRGGSAANVAAAAARSGRAARFIGQVGNDPIGTALIDELRADGVDTGAVRRGGTTGTIVALVDPEGERSMLTDRRACVDLDDPLPVWLDGVEVLHVPFYSLVVPPLADTSKTLIGWARERGIVVSVDASSSSVIEQVGVDRSLRTLTEVGPDILLANRDEARVLELTTAFGSAITVLKRGADPVVVLLPAGDRIEVDHDPFDRVVDSTGAGDAFAAGFLTHAPLADPVSACRAGHATAVALLTAR
jgi:sugar/nucleoside kinase (ribokinase family)